MFFWCSSCRPHNISICVCLCVCLCVFGCHSERMLPCLRVWESNTTDLCNDYTSTNTVITIITATVQRREGSVASIKFGFLRRLPATWEETLKGEIVFVILSLKLDPTGNTLSSSTVKTKAGWFVQNKNTNTKGLYSALCDVIWPVEKVCPLPRGPVSETQSYN